MRVSPDKTCLAGGDPSREREGPSCDLQEEQERAAAAATMRCLLRPEPPPKAARRRIETATRHGRREVDRPPDTADKRIGPTRASWGSSSSTAAPDGRFFRDSTPSNPALAAAPELPAATASP